MLQRQFCHPWEAFPRDVTMSPAAIHFLQFLLKLLHRLNPAWTLIPQSNIAGLGINMFYQRLNSLLVSIFRVLNFIIVI